MGHKIYGRSMNRRRKLILQDFFLGGDSAYEFSSQYRAVLDYAQANGGSPPSDSERKIQEDIFVRKLVYEGVFADAEQIFLLETHGDETFSLINVASPGTRNGSKVGTPTFTPGSGWSSAGSLANYIRTNFIPQTHATKLAQNNAGIIFYTPTNEAASGTKVEFGGNEASLGDAIVSSVFVGSGTGAANIRINGSTNYGVPISASNGLHHFFRAVSNAIQIYFRGLSVGTSGANNSTGLSSIELYILVYNNNGTPAGGTTKTAGLWIIGKAFNGSEFNLNAYHKDYISTPQLVTTPSFPNWKTVSNDLSGYLTSTSQLAASVSSPVVNQMLVKGTGALTGSNQWQGGALAENDCIYYAPSSAQTVLKVNTLTDLYSLISTSATSQVAKYGGAVVSSVNGKVYFNPQNATAVMVIDPDDDSSYFFDSTGVVADNTAGNLGAGLKFYGLYEGADGRIYCIPYDSTEVMVINPVNDSISYIDTTGVTTRGAGNLSGSAKWDCGFVHGDYIYGVPSTATDMLKINTLTGAVSRIGTFPVGTNKWALATLGPNDRVYIFPYIDNRIIKFNPNDDSFSYLATTIGAIDASLKVGGCSIMPDGRIITVPGDTNTAYIVDTTTDSVTAVGYASLGSILGPITGAKFISTILAKNGASYACPFNSDFVLKQYYEGKRISLPANFVFNRHARGA